MLIFLLCTAYHYFKDAASSASLDTMPVCVFTDSANPTSADTMFVRVFTDSANPTSADTVPVRVFVNVVITQNDWEKGNIRFFRNNRILCVYNE